MAFWKKCHQRLQRDGTEAEAAQRFFQAQVDLETRSESEELLDIQERCLLLCLAAHWLSQLSQVPVDQLENLEKKLWLLQVRLHMLAADVEKTSVFRLLPMSASPGMDAYEALMKDLSMSKLSCLNTDTWLCLDGLPGPSDEPLLAPEEGRVLSALICRLLDKGSVREASRLSRYFSLHHQDLWLVLRCRSLANGDLKLEAPEEASEAPPRTGITPCKRRQATPLPESNRQRFRSAALRNSSSPLTVCCLCSVLRQQPAVLLHARPPRRRSRCPAAEVGGAVLPWKQLLQTGPGPLPALQGNQR